MSTDEIREQKVRLQIELEDALTELNALREKSTRMGEHLVRLGEWLKREPHTLYRNGSSIHGGIDIGTLRTFTEADLNALDPNQIFKVTNDIREAMTKVENLQLRRSRL